MPLYVGSGSDDFEAKSDRVGVPIETSDPNPASVGDMYFNNPSGKLRVYDGTSWADVGGSADISGNVSGGTLYTPTLSDGIYEFRVFDSPGTLTVSNAPVDVEAVIIAGGGGGARGGGGGGGVIGRAFNLSPGSYPVSVGGPGAKGPSANTTGCQGGNSVFNGYTAFGGGGGGGSPGAGQAGGSGGGSAAGAGAGGTGCPGQGFPGGCQSNPTNNQGAGGGGYVFCGRPWNFNSGAAGGGGGGSVTWCLPSSVCGTDPTTGATIFSGGGGGACTLSVGCPGGGFYGRGGSAHTGPGANNLAGCGGAVFIKYKKFQ